MSLKQRGEHPPELSGLPLEVYVLSPTISSVSLGDRAVLLHLAGELDLAVAPELRGELEAAVATRAHIVVDAADMTFLDCSCLGLLNAARVRARESGGGLSLVAPAPCVTRLLELTGLEEHFPVHPDLRSALAATSISA